MNQLKLNASLLFMVLTISIIVGCSDETEVGDNNENINITSTDTSVTEGDLATISLSLSEVMTTEVTVHYSTQNGTAIAGIDYNTASGTITFQAGETTKNITIETIADGDFSESDKEFTVSFLNPSNNVTLTDNTSTISVLNLEEPSSYFISGEFNGEFRLFTAPPFPSGDIEVINLGSPPHIYYAQSALYVGGLYVVGISFSKIFPDQPTNTEIIDNTYNSGFYPYNDGSEFDEGVTFSYGEFEGTEEGLGWISSEGTQPSISSFEITSSEEIISTISPGMTITTRRIKCEFNCVIYSPDAEPITITNGKAYMLMPNSF